MSSLHLTRKFSKARTPDLGFLETFPGGVAGAPLTAQYSTLSIPAVNADDALCQEIEDYQTKIGNSATLLNQINTLYNRTNQMSDLLDENGGVPALNPTSVIDLQARLDELRATYQQDRDTLAADMGSCLGTTGNSDCTAVENLLNGTAFDYYAADGANPDFEAQQNTLALQYIGEDGATPLDVMYIGDLQFSGLTPPDMIAGQAGFVGFQDRPLGGSEPAVPFVDFLTLNPDTAISPANISLKVLASDGSFTLVNLNGLAGGGTLKFDAFAKSNFAGGTSTCQPTFDDACKIDYSVGPTNVIVQNEPIETLFPDPQFTNGNLCGSSTGTGD